MADNLWTPDSPAYGPNAPDSGAKVVGPEICIKTPVKTPYDDAELLPSDKHAGHIFQDGIEVAMTLQCCHCNAHWIHRKGSGIRRGFCMRCGQVTCGKRGCDVCVPFEKKLEMYERNQGSLV